MDDDDDDDNDKDDDERYLPDVMDARSNTLAAALMSFETVIISLPRVVMIDSS